MSQALVLVVDDNDSGRELLRRRLNRAGYRVITAHDGAEAVATAHAHHPDLILMDKRLPRLDGYAATRALQDAEDTCHIPVICLTADASEEDQQAACAAGCRGFVTKPVEFQTLLATMSSLLPDD